MLVILFSEELRRWKDRASALEWIDNMKGSKGMEMGEVVICGWLCPAKRYADCVLPILI